MPSRRDHSSGASFLSRRFAPLLVVGLLLFSPIAWAHDGPNEVIEQLTLKMERQGRTAELLYQRASEYRTLGKLDRAVGDLQAALRRSPKHFAAALELSRIQLKKSDADAALATIQDALRHATPTDRSVGLMQRSEVLFANGDLQQALADANAAIAARPDQVDWYLHRGDIYAKLQQPAEQAQSLEAGWRQTQSGALKVAWIDALIDAGQADQALAKIERELAEARYKSSWLIRRARCHLQLHSSDAAHADLRQAIDEITPRIHPLRPDASLIIDRGQAHALLGETDLAKADLHRAQAHHADASMTQRLQRMMAQPK